MTFLPKHVAPSCGCDDPAQTSQLITIDEAFQRIKRHVQPISDTETVPLHAARGRILARPVCAKSDMPRFDHAAMDGYAVDSTVFTGAGPWLLPVTGRVAAGDDPTTRCGSADACRIFTGAPIPRPFDSVVMQEQIERRGDVVRFTVRPAAGENVRRRGEEHLSGAEILPEGTVLTPRAIATCAAAGQGTATVTKRLRIILLVTGSEVATPGASDLTAGHIWDVNTPMLQSLLSRPDVDLHKVVRVEDSRDTIRHAMQSAAADADLIVTTGGVSVGDEDHMHAAVRAAGGKLVFAGVAIKPGKPVALGQIGKATWLGLPGNPGSAFVTWSIFGEVIRNTLGGRRDTSATRRHVVLSHDVTRKAGRCEIRAARVIGVDGLGRDVIDCSSAGNSGQVSKYVDAEGLVFLPSEVDHIPVGSLVELLPFCTI
ncbi:MAG: molybdopterin molybdotransferase MoeA [Pseudomonadota bacterium]